LGLLIFCHHYISTLAWDDTTRDMAGNTGASKQNRLEVMEPIAFKQLLLK
jgi:hypothetical protein